MFNFSLKMDSNNIKTIDDLPQEILIEILKQISFRKDLYLISKKFYYAYCLINQSKITLSLETNYRVMQFFFMCLFSVVNQLYLTD